jgi:hypothetical protein
MGFLRNTGTGAWRGVWDGTFSDSWTEASTARAVYHIVINSTLGNQDNRVLVYKDGTLVTTDVRELISINETFGLGSDLD